MLGWGLGLEAPVRLRDGYAAMAPSTCLCFALCGSALFAQLRGGLAAEAFRVIAALSVFATGAVNLGLLTRGDGGIDRALLGDFGGLPQDGMAVSTSVCFLLTAVALVLARATGPHAMRARVTAGTAALLVAGFDLVGYVFDTEALYRLSSFSAMALHTSLSFVALLIGMLSVRPQDSWMGAIHGDGEGDQSARRLLPLAILAPVCLGLATLQMSRAGILDMNSRLSLFATLTMLMLTFAILRNARTVNRHAAHEARALARAREAVQERDFLLEELRHRIKNNLQQLVAMIAIEERVQAEQAGRPVTLASLNGRVQALATIHELLASTPRPDYVELGHFLERLCEAIAAGRHAPGVIDIRVEADPWVAHMEVAASIGHIVNELVTNALKHAFAERKAGVVTVQFAECADGRVELVVEDDGVGLPASSASGGLGLMLVRSLCQQMHGGFRQMSGPQGTRVVLSFPVEEITGGTVKAAAAYGLG